MSIDTFNIWDGIYQSFAQTQADLSAFASDRWQQGLLNKNKKLQAVLQTDNFLAPPTNTMPYPLALVCATLDNPLMKILDFGGGLGICYLELLTHLPSDTAFNYHVVEQAEVCTLGRDCMRAYPNLYFHESLPETQTEFDVIHIGSALQYIEDWQGLLARMCDYTPKYFILSDLMAGNIPTFVSTQAYYGKKIPTWFWDIQDILDFFCNMRYTLAYKAAYLGHFLGKKQALPMQNFPASHRLQHACHLVFKPQRSLECRAQP